MVKAEVPSEAAAHHQFCNFGDLDSDARAGTAQAVTGRGARATRSRGRQRAIL